MANEADDSEEEKEEDGPVRDDWVSVVYTVNVLMKEMEI